MNILVTDIDIKLDGGVDIRVTASAGHITLWVEVPDRDGFGIGLPSEHAEAVAVALQEMVDTAQLLKKEYAHD